MSAIEVVPSVHARPRRAPILEITAEEVRADLDAGRGRGCVDVAREPVGRDRGERPEVGGRAFLATLGAAQAVGRVRPSAARGLLERLWFTPWAARRTAVPDPAGAVPITVDAGPWQLSGWTLGTGPVVLLVHGWGGRATDLRHLARPLADAGMRVVAVDLPAHGRSPGARTQLYEIAGAIRALADVTGPVHAVVAHSFGAPAVAMALRDGLRVDRVVTIAGARRLQSALETFVAQARLTPGLAEELHDILEERYGAGVWQDTAADVLLRGLDVPALLVHDTDDRDVSMHDADRLAAAWRGSRRLVTEGLGHRRILRDEAVIAATTAFVAAS